MVITLLNMGVAPICDLYTIDIAYVLLFKYPTATR